MADFERRFPRNVTGKYYVDNVCFWCRDCQSIAPMIFRQDEETENAYVFKQPETPEEIRLANEAIASCCVEAIGDDGDTGDWLIPTKAILPHPPKRSSAKKTRQNCQVDEDEAQNSGLLERE